MIILHQIKITENSNTSNKLLQILITNKEQHLQQVKVHRTFIRNHINSQNNKVQWVLK